MNITCDSTTAAIHRVIFTPSDCRFTPIGILARSGFPDKYRFEFMGDLGDLLWAPYQSAFVEEIFPKVLPGPTAHDAAYQEWKGFITSELTICTEQHSRT